VLVIACPGQGSQTSGFLAPWLEVPGVADRAAALSDVAGIDLVAHGTTSDEDTIKDTAVAQPLIVAAGLLTHGVLAGDAASPADVLAGHSVGEITAAGAAGVLDDADAMRFVRERSQGMAAASAATPTGMSAVLGGDADEVLATIERHGLTPANMNAAGQVVAAGTLEQLAALAAEPPTKARVIPLKVAGAFHTGHMASAVEALRALADGLSPADPTTRVVSNRDGQVVPSGADVVDRLVAQVTSPVRWDLCSAAFADLGVTGFIELAPAGTLAGLAKRALPGVEILAVKSPDDLEAAERMIRDHAGTTPASEG
jgi:[acyl-carrier-protein] S-malonyltransferase